MILVAVKVKPQVWMGKRKKKKYCLGLFHIDVVAADSFYPFMKQLLNS